MALAVLIPTAGVALGTEGVAQAAVVQWGTGSDQSPNYQATVNGDFTMTGNGVLACTGSALTATNTSGSCTDLHANNPGTGVSTSYNDYFKMVNSNTVSGFTTNSSTGALTIPAGATVAKAYLDWSANPGVFTGAGNVTCSGNSANGSQWYATPPDAAAGRVARARGPVVPAGRGGRRDGAAPGRRDRHPVRARLDPARDLAHTGAARSRARRLGAGPPGPPARRIPVAAVRGRDTPAWGPRQ